MVFSLDNELFKWKGPPNESFKFNFDRDLKDGVGSIAVIAIEQKLLKQK